MSTQQLFIPDKLKVGFNHRGDTYTGQLAYVIYYDKKGVLRKEKSWEGWRNKSIEAQEYPNEPTEGFVLNKSGGGNKSYHHYNPRNEFIRVYDPRNFEFEISVANLLFILKETDCSRGKGLEGKFVYAWDKNNLMLLPVNSQEYKSSSEFTELQDKGVKAKDLIPGATYITKQQKTLTYLGKFDYFFQVQDGPAWHAIKASDQKGVLKRQIFWDGKNFIPKDSMKEIAALVSDNLSPKYAGLVDKYNKSRHGSRVVELYLKECSVPPLKCSGHNYLEWYKETTPEVFRQYQISLWISLIEDPFQETFPFDKIDHIDCQFEYQMKNGILYRKYISQRAYSKTGKFKHYQSTMSWVDFKNVNLWAKLESGSEFHITYNTFDKE